MNTETAMQLVKALERISMNTAPLWGIWVTLILIMVILMRKR